MKTKIVILIVAALLLLANCTQSKTEPYLSSLAGTHWKLAGIVNVQTGKLTELAPENCKDCYTLTFETEYRAVAHSIDMNVVLDLQCLDPFKNLNDMLVLELYNGEYYGEGDNFRRKIILTASYTVAYQALKLFNYEQTEYLLFKLKRQ
ncbi:MAG: hypothetical protein LBS01_11315 [Prevotellaceae bacterium]|jgi:hypothetical protein|nr:hypothetical protein [Prevotellaceae bacterium]